MQSTLEMLQFAKYVADDHIQRLHGTISCIKSKGGPTWPRTTDTKHKEIADTAASQLLEDYEELLQRAQRLSQRCADQTSLLVNNSMLAQSKRNIWQAERVARLTLLAFLFIPLSFTASIFGMNVMELENGDGPRLSIWVWVVVSVPTFAVAFLVCFWDSVWGYLKMILSHALHGK
jgi:Mg2+ and Co2+ transporter CorA